MTTNLTAGFDNMLISGEKQQHHNKYRLIGFVNFLLTNFAANCLWILISPFIGSIWLSSNYLLDNQIVFILIFNFIVVNLSSVTNTMRSASGEYKQDRGVQLVVALIKISLSWIGINLFGLRGLLLATSVAYVIREGIIVPRIVYGTVLKVPIYLYHKEYLYFLTIFICFGSSNSVGTFYIS